MIRNFIRKTSIFLSIIVSIATNKVSADTTIEDIDKLLQKVLSHENLADTKYIQKTMELEVLIPEFNHSERIEAIIKNKPPFMMASELSYDIRPSEKKNYAHIYLKFRLKNCAEIGKIGKAWKKPSRIDAPLHAPYTTQKIIWNEKKKVSLLISSGICSLQLDQDNIPFKSINMTPIERQSPEPILSKMIQMHRIEELRDYKKISSALQTNMELPSVSIKNGLLFDGRATFLDLVPFSDEILYLGNDTGWERAERGNKRAINRYVYIHIPVDNRQVCITREDFNKSPEFEGLVFNNWASNFYTASRETVKGKNRITTSINLRGECATSFRFAQETDYESQISKLLTFDLNSTTTKDGYLSDHTLSKISSIADYIQGTGIAKITVYKNPGKESTKDIKGKLNDLANTIKGALKSNERLGSQSIDISEIDQQRYKFEKWFESPSVYLEILAAEQ